MAGMVSQLLDILSEQTQRYEELLGLSTEKRDAIVKDDIEYLQKITNLENIVVSQTQKLERKRLEIMKDIADVMGKRNVELTLEALVGLLDGQEEQKKLKEAGKRLRNILDELAAVNDLNASLIQNALEYIEYSVNVMQSSINQNPTMYTVKGGKLKEDTSLFDAKN
jgi:flagellar biosynthesis/type III secretory pathway chaperone